MKISHYRVSAALAFAGFVFSSSVFAMPGFSEEAPMSSVRVCVAEIGEQANYAGAVRVRHEVSSKERRVSGHKISVDTTVFGADGERVIREYTSICSVSDDKETKRFKIKEKSL